MNQKMTMIKKNKNIPKINDKITEEEKKAQRKISLRAYQQKHRAGKKIRERIAMMDKAKKIGVPLSASVNHDMPKNFIEAETYREKKKATKEEIEETNMKRAAVIRKIHKLREGKTQLKSSGVYTKTQRAIDTAKMVYDAVNGIPRSTIIYPDGSCTEKYY